MGKILEELSKPSPILAGILDAYDLPIAATFIRNGTTDKIYSVTGLFADLNTEIDLDVQVVHKRLKELGIPLPSAAVLEDQSKKDCEELFKKMRKDTKDNWEKNKEYTINYIHVGGHGVMKNNKVHLVCNTTNKKEALFDIEAKLRNLGSVPGAFVIAVLDICRESMPAILE